MVSPLRWQDGALEILDQTRLPAEEAWLRCERPEQVADAIRRLAVRGAPAIGIAAAYGLALAEPSPAGVEHAIRLLGSTRPTAVNLSWALERGRRAFESGGAQARPSPAAPSSRPHAAGPPAPPPHRSAPSS